MRRQFNQKILPTVPPKKYEQKKREPSEQGIPIRELLVSLRERAGDKYNLDDFAKACSVRRESANHWFYGYLYGQDTVNNIARYFAPLVREPLPKLRRKLEEARMLVKSGR